MHEARIEETDAGLVPADNGWFVLNLRDIAWATVEGGGTWCEFESKEPPRNTLGIGVQILWPGDTPGYYHRESEQEGFLVLSGECVLVVEGEERRLGPWDYFHCPPETAHITIGAGDGPCAILMVGTRTPDHRIRYLVDAAATRYGAAVERETDDPREAYAERPPITPARSPWPLEGA
jgi:uncharacterized cupin superfamily protein